ncbi:MAG: ABC transporter ATP-binding protein [Alphaproteobacteria bacterium]|nr:ABC transporter ATP-binding protein [Alphaproteobacteria bacterium]
MNTGAWPVAIENLSVWYDRRRALEEVSVAVAPGEIFALVGLNGAGKTTIIKAMLGLIAATGTVSLCGVDHRDPASRRAIVYLPEKFQPSPLLKGWEFLSLSLSCFKMPLDREAALSVANNLEFNVQDLGRRIGTYSKGMMQKVGLMAALLVQRPLVILDEPTSGLDPQARHLLKNALRAYTQSGGTVFFSSHILADVDEICQRMAVIHEGRLRFLGTPEALKSVHSGQTLERAFLAEIGNDGE